MRCPSPRPCLQVLSKDTSAPPCNVNPVAPSQGTWHSLSSSMRTGPICSFHVPSPATTSAASPPHSDSALPTPCCQRAAAARCRVAPPFARAWGSCMVRDGARGGETPAPSFPTGSGCEVVVVRYSLDIRFTPALRAHTCDNPFLFAARPCSMCRANSNELRARVRRRLLCSCLGCWAAELGLSATGYRLGPPSSAQHPE